jgi:hypothetical protein
MPGNGTVTAAANSCTKARDPTTSPQSGCRLSQQRLELLGRLAGDGAGRGRWRRVSAVPGCSGVRPDSRAEERGRVGSAWKKYCRGEMPDRFSLPPDIPATPDKTYRGYSVNVRLRKHAIHKLSVTLEHCAISEMWPWRYIQDNMANSSPTCITNWLKSSCLLAMEYDSKQALTTLRLVTMRTSMHA